MKKILTIAVILAGALLLAIFTNVSNINADNEKSNKIVHTDTAIQNDNPIKNLVSHQTSTLAKVKDTSPDKIDDNNDISPIVTSEAKERKPTFTRSETAEEVLQASGKLRENLQGEVYLEVDNEYISSLEAGDTLELDVPFFNMEEEVKVESTKIDSRGNKTLNAKLWINEDLYNTTITINEHAIYGHVETPNGTYSIAGNGQYAWMAESRDLIRGAVPDQIGGNDYDGSSDPQPVSEPKPINITGK